MDSISFLDLFSRIFIASLLLFAGFAVYESIRRLAFHPLAKIPGPRLAALTWWYEFYYDVIKEGQYIFKIQELHKQYGPIIRVTPDEIHINDVGFLDTVYAPTSQRRDKYAYQLRTLRIPGSVGATTLHQVHRKRRESLSPFFSRKNVLSLEPTIMEKVEQVCQVITKHAVDRTPVNLSDVFFGYSNDVVVNFLFANKVNVLGDEAKAAELRRNTYSLLTGIHGNKHFPWIPDFLESLPHSISKPIMPPGLIDLLTILDKARAELMTVITAKSSKGSAVDAALQKSVFMSVVDNPILPPAERSLLRLEQEGALLVLAGTGSPAFSLQLIMYHLLAKPDILARLKAELETLPVDASSIQLEQLPYLSAVVEEGHRLTFGVSARMARIAHEPLVYKPSKYCTSPPNLKKEYTIPANTPVSISTLAVHTDRTIFPDPWTFNPERWLGEEGKERRKFNMAFGKGSRICIGMELTKPEVLLAVDRLVRGFEMELYETSEDEVGFAYEYHVPHPKKGSKGVRVMVKVRD